MLPPLLQPYEINLILTSVALKLIATLPPVLEPALLQPVVEGGGGGAGQQTAAEGGGAGQQTAAEGGGAGQQTLHSVLLKVCAFQCCNTLLASHLPSCCLWQQGLLAFVPGELSNPSVDITHKHWHSLTVS